MSKITIMTIATCSLGLIALFFVLVHYCRGRHFNAEMKLYRYEDECGKVQLGVEYCSWQANTLLGLLVGSFGIALSRAKNEKVYRKELSEFNAKNR